MDNLERLLEDLLTYAENGLTLDKQMTQRIKFFLNMQRKPPEDTTTTSLWE